MQQHYQPPAPFQGGAGLDSDRIVIGRQHCHLTIRMELVELTNSEAAAANPSGGGARSLRSLSSLEIGSG